MLRWILLSLLGLLLLLFFCRVRVELLSLDGVVTARLRLLHIFSLKVYPFPQTEQSEAKKARKRKKAAKAPKKKETAPKAPKPKEPMVVMDIIQTINDMLPIVGRSMGYWMRHTTIDRLWVRTVIHEEDAADTAIRCGQLSAAAQTLYTWCNSRIRIKDFSFNAVPNFISEEQPLNLSLHISAAPSSMVCGLVLFLCRGGVALWRGPLVAQRIKKQPEAEPRANNKRVNQAAREATQQ